MQADHRTPFGFVAGYVPFDDGGAHTKPGEPGSNWFLQHFFAA
jgi:hypothetical protein